MSLFVTGVPHIARVYNYWLGGKDHFAADREMGKRTIAAYPALPLSARANRAFLVRAVEFLAGEAGIRQFLDIGTGLPWANNTHEVAQRVAPECRIGYVDNDPIVLSHAQALLTSSRAGACAYINADLRDPVTVLDSAAGTLDFGKPVAVMCLASIQFVADLCEASAIVKRLMDACAPGSYLAISHPASDIAAEQVAKMVRRLNERTLQKTTLRDRASVARLFEGCDLVEPGVVPAPEWRPRSQAEATSPAAVWAGVARKPLTPPAQPGRKLITLGPWPDSLSNPAFYLGWS